MPSIDYGDRIITVGGRESWLKRPSQPFNAYYGGGIVRLSGAAKTISFRQLYEQQPWVAICCNKLTRQVSRLPLKVYERDSQNQKKRVYETQLELALRKPEIRAGYSPKGPTHTKQGIALPSLVHGNAVLAKARERPAAAPSGLRFLRWPFIEPQVDDSGCVYAWKSTETGDTEWFAPEEVLHFGWVSPDGDVGVSPLQQLEVTLRAEDAAQRYESSSFSNGARGSTAIVLPPEARYDKEQRDAIREETQAVHGGVDNAFKTWVIGGGADIKEMSQTAVEAELIEARKINREEIAAAYDIPPPLIGILDKATYSNIETQHQMLYTDVLGPWLVMIEETIQAQLIDPEPAFEGLFVEFDLAEVLKGDKLKEIQALREAIGTGLMKPNEGRQVLNLPVVGDMNDEENPANKLYLPMNNLQPLGSEAKPQTVRVETAQGALNQALARVKDRVLRKTKAGADDPLDADRFERELQQDLESHMNGNSEQVAQAWRQTVEQGVADAQGDLTSLEQFFQALGA